MIKKKKEAIKTCWSYMVLSRCIVILEKDMIDMEIVIVK